MRLFRDRRVKPVSVEFDGAGSLVGATGTVGGYEIYMGGSRIVDGVTPVSGDSAALRSVARTRIHDLFANDAPRDALVDIIYESARRDRPATTTGAAGADTDADEPGAGDPYDHAAAFVADSFDVAAFCDLLGLEEQGSVETTSQPISDWLPTRRQ